MSADKINAAIAVMEKNRRMQRAANIPLVATLNQRDCVSPIPPAMASQQKGKTLSYLSDTRVP